MVIAFPWQLIFSLSGGALFIGIAVWVFFRKWVVAGERKVWAKVKYAKREALLEAKEYELKASQEFERDKALLRQKYGEMGAEIARRESELKEGLKAFEVEKAAVEDLDREVKRMSGELRRKGNNLENLRQLYRRRLMQVAHVSEEEAREMLKEEVMEECSAEVRQIRQEILGKGMDEVNEEARRRIVDAMQRLSVVPSSNMSAALVKLPNEEMKGRLIGKEGRNIKSFETETGATLLIDDTPGTVLVSSFDPVRREVARLTLEALIQDGRIHPVTIEEIVKKTKERIDKEVMMHGERAVMRLNLKGVGEELMRHVGNLYYRLSNNQNTLEHSIEVGYLCSMLASELGLDPVIAKRCGLFHDIGKAIDCESEGSHATVAASLLRRNGEDERVVNAVEASHEEVVSESVYAELLKAADRLSATRPGARSDSMEGYVQRINSLEKIAKSFDGVEDVYAIQAGREIRIVVSPEVYEPHEACVLSSRIRRRIEEELSYPGKIKVTVIREERFVDMAH